MTIEVHSTGKPAIAGRATIIMALVAMGTLALAGWFAHARGSDPLGARMTPEGWSVSFRPPREFTPRHLLVSHVLGPAIRFSGPCGNGECELTYWQIPLRELIDAETLAGLVAQSTRAWTWSDLVGRRAPSEAAPAMLGTMRGAEIVNESEGTQVRAAAMSPTIAAAVALKHPPVPLNSKLRDAFDASCRSLELTRHPSLFENR